MLAIQDLQKLIERASEFNHKTGIEFASQRFGSLNYFAASADSSAALPA
jgi:hypothetical protein